MAPQDRPTLSFGERLGFFVRRCFHALQDFLDFRLGQPIHFAGTQVIDRADNLGLARFDEVAHGRALHEKVFYPLPHVFLDCEGHDGRPVHVLVLVHGAFDRRDDVVDQGRNVAFQFVAVAVQRLGDRRDGTAAGVAQDDEHGRIHVGQPILDGADLIRVADVARHADDEEVHDAGVEDQLHRDPGIGA